MLCRKGRQAALDSLDGTAGQEASDIQRCVEKYRALDRA